MLYVAIVSSVASAATRATRSLDRSIGPHLTAFKRWTMSFDDADWRQRAYELERARIETHARLFGAFLPEDDVPRAVGAQLRFHPHWTPFDYWEAEVSCADERRVPAKPGPGPKWVCGPHQAPCQAVSLMNGFDDTFEAGAGRLFRCDAIVHDTTVAETRQRAIDLKLRVYGARLNTSDVPLSALLNKTLAMLNVQLPDALSALVDIGRLCHNGSLVIDQLNVAVRLGADVVPSAIYDALAVAPRQCRLALHHKERNDWSEEGGAHHVNLAFVSLRQARLARTITGA